MFTVECIVAQGVCVYSDLIFEDDFDCFNVELLVVNDKNFKNVIIVVAHTWTVVFSYRESF